MVITDWIGILKQENGHAGLNAVVEISHNPQETCSVNNLSKNCQVNSSSHARIVADEIVAKGRGKYHAKALWPGRFYSKGTRFRNVRRTKKLIYELRGPRHNAAFEPHPEP